MKRRTFLSSVSLLTVGCMGTESKYSEDLELLNYSKTTKSSLNVENNEVLVKEKPKSDSILVKTILILRNGCYGINFTVEDTENIHVKFGTESSQSNNVACTQAVSYSPVTIRLEFEELIMGKKIYISTPDTEDSYTYTIKKFENSTVL